MNINTIWFPFVSIIHYGDKIIQLIIRDLTNYGAKINTPLSEHIFCFHRFPFSINVHFFWTFLDISFSGPKKYGNKIIWPFFGGRP